MASLGTQSVGSSVEGLQGRLAQRPEEGRCQEGQLARHSLSFVRSQSVGFLNVLKVLEHLVSSLWAGLDGQCGLSTFITTPKTFCIESGGCSFDFFMQSPRAWNMPRKDSLAL